MQGCGSTVIHSLSTGWPPVLQKGVLCQKTALPRDKVKKWGKKPA